MNQSNKPLAITRLNMILSWLSIFIESWLLLLKRLPMDGISVFFFCFFILVAIGAWLGTVIDERDHQSNHNKEKSK